MALTVKHSTTVVVPDDPAYPVGTDEWNANHTVTGTLASTDITGLGTLATQNGTFSGTSSGTNTGDQTITLTGNVTGSGTGSFAATLDQTAAYAFSGLGKTVISPGTLADQAHAFTITTTQPTTPTALQDAVILNITSAGNAAQQNRGLSAYYLAGYTGSSSTTAIVGDNGALGTGSVLVPGAGSNLPTGNIGVIGRTVGTTTGLNAGFGVSVGNGNINVAVHAASQVSKTNALNIGALGTAFNGASGGIQIGGYFSLLQTTNPTVSAALMADNGAQTSPVFLGRVNGTTTWQVDANGNPAWRSDGSTIVTSPASAKLQLGDANAASPIAQTLQAQGSRAGTDSNVGGANLTIAPGTGTGTGTISSLALQSPVAVASGTGAQTQTTGLTIKAGVAVLTSYTVATLPAAATAGAGATAFVTDASTTIILGLGLAVVGGGANKVPVYSDGTNWIIG